MVFDFKDYKDQEDFEIWAFGHTRVSYDISTLYAWNSFHGKELRISPGENIQESMKKMYSLYLKEKELWSK